MNEGDTDTMRFVDDDDLSFCMTVSKGVELDTLLTVLGKVEILPVQQTFDDFTWDTHQPGKTGLLNVFSEDGYLVTLENNGYLGVTRRSLNKMALITEDIGHYVSIYHSAGNAGYQYVEVQDGLVVANFDPLLDEAPAAVAEFFPKGEGVSTIQGMINALEFRMEIRVKPEWLDQQADTYVIDYRTDRR